MRVALVLLMLVLLPQPRPAEPHAISVWYEGRLAAVSPSSMEEDARVRADLALIRRGGFNAITRAIRWRDVEAVSGRLRLEPIERLLASAADVDLAMSLVLYDDEPPAWAAGSPDTARSAFRDAIVSRLTSHKALRRVLLSREAESPDRLIVVGTAGVSPARGRLLFWKAIAAGVREVSFRGDGLTPGVLALGETVGVVTRNAALFTPLTPRTGGVASISGDSGKAEVKLLESEEALVIVGLNDSAEPSTTRITFGPDIPEAIWQNLETGAAVNFVMGQSGPYYDYTFAPNDTLVLMIRKTLR